MLGAARLENRLRFSSPKNNTAQSSPQFSAPCQPHCGSAFAPPLFSRALRADRASSRTELPCAGGGRVTPAGRSDTAYRLISSAQFFIRAPRLKERASVLREGTALGPRGPHVPWTGNAGAFQLAASTPVLCPRAGGNLIQTRTTRLNDFLLQQSRAGRALSRLELFFLTSLRSFSSSPLGNLQTAFALLSLAASVVNKKNQKTDAATERHQTCLNGRGARRNRVAFREQRPFTGYAEIARGSRRQRVAKL